MKNTDNSSNYSYVNDSLHPGEILGHEDNPSKIWLFCISIPFEDQEVTSVAMSRKSFAFRKIYVANPRSLSEPLKFKIVDDLRWHEIHSRAKIGHFHSLGRPQIHCKRIKTNIF